MRILRLATLSAIMIFAGWCATRLYSAEPRRPSSIKIVRIPASQVLELRPVLAKNGTEEFSSIVQRMKPKAAVNGTFYGKDYRPLGDIWWHGRQYAKGRYPNAFAVTNRGKALIVRRPKREHFKTDNYRMLIAAGPVLVKGGKMSLHPQNDGFSRAAMVKKAVRTGVGVTKSGDVVLIVELTPVTLAQFSRTMMTAGAVEAINFDGGAATGMVQDGKLVATPLLPMTNVLVWER